MSDLPTKRPPPLVGVPRPTPLVPDRHLPRPQTSPAAPAPRPEPEPPSVAPQVDIAIGRATRAVIGKLWPILVAGVLGTGGAVAYQQTTNPPERADRRGEQVRELQRDLQRTRDELAETRGQVRALREWATEYQAWSMALEAARGVKVRQPEGAAPLPAIETTAPTRPPRRSGAPAMTVQSPPPAPP